MEQGISQGKASLQEHRMLYHALVEFLAEHLDPGSRKHRAIGDMGDTGENATVTPTYCYPLHNYRTVSLTSDLSCGTVGEQGIGGDAVLGGKPANR